MLTHANLLSQVRGAWLRCRVLQGASPCCGPCRHVLPHLAAAPQPPTRPLHHQVRLADALLPGPSLLQLANLQYFLSPQPGEQALSLLPPWHIYERTVT